MKRSTKIILWVALLHVPLTIFSVGYFLLFEYIAIVWLVDLIGRIIVFGASVAVAPWLLWLLGRQVKREVTMPGNALAWGMLGWLLGQCAISVAIAIAYAVPGELPVVDSFTQVIQAPWWQVLLELAASLPVGLAVFYFRKMMCRQSADA